MFKIVKGDDQMIELGKTYSGIRPLEFDVRETKVFVAKNIEEHQVRNEDVGDGSSELITEYSFDYYEYTKDEFIKMLSEKNETLEEELTSTQMALCEIYEELV